jgi:MFS family permease
VATEGVSGGLFTAANINLFLLLAIGSCKQIQQETFSYMYGFVGSGANFGNPYYEISSSFGNLSQYYGFLSGAGFSITYCFAAIFWGITAETVNRKKMVSLACIAFSLCSIVTG